MRLPDRRHPFLIGMAVLGLIVAYGCGEGPAAVEGGGSIPVEFQAGEGAFKMHCSKCHGHQGKGTQQGPPLVHRIYEPSHHGDGAFLRAVAHGVRAHHWKFGDMPKISGVSQEEVEAIVAYVRWLQRNAGIHKLGSYRAGSICLLSSSDNYPPRLDHLALSWLAEQQSRQRG